MNKLSEAKPPLATINLEILENQLIKITFEFNKPTTLDEVRVLGTEIATAIANVLKPEVFPAALNGLGMKDQSVWAVAENLIKNHISSKEKPVVPASEVFKNDN